MLDKILKRALEEGTGASIDEALMLDEKYTTEELCDAADEVRRRWSGNHVHTCSIVNARSGKCGEDCKWCAQSIHHNTGVTEYEHISRDEMMRAFHANKEHGVMRFSLVTSGRKMGGSHLDYFCRLIEEAREEGGVGLCASMGLLSRDELQKLWDAGVRRYHCNLETSPAFFPSLCSTHTTDDKLKTIRDAREIGFDICSGGIIGMGETLRDRLELAATARDAGADSMPINILSPIKGTPLADVQPISEEEIMRSVALMRLVAPKVGMHFAGGRARLSHAAMLRMLRGGINGALMGDMLTTVGNKMDEDRRLFAEAGYEDPLP